MRSILIVVDMQKDFVDGALGTPEAVTAAERAAEKIRGFAGEIIVTMDTHFENYLHTAEGQKLPVPHCIKGTSGWALDRRIAEALADKPYTVVEKNTFGSVELPRMLSGDFSVELIGLCTDICVISNALLIKAHHPERPIAVDLACCAGVTPETHNAAAETMKMCQIEVR